MLFYLLSCVICLLNKLLIISKIVLYHLLCITNYDNAIAKINFVLHHEIGPCHSHGWLFIHRKSFVFIHVRVEKGIREILPNISRSKHTDFALVLITFI